MHAAEQIEARRLGLTAGLSGVQSPTNDLRNLDLLRAFAVLAVAGSRLYRYCNKAPSWATFVDNLGIGGVLFFVVHTALVLLLSMERTKSPHLTLGSYIRRALRIYPLCWVCIALVLTTHLTDVPYAKIVQMGWRGLPVNIFLVQNVIRYPNVEMPLWSLPWEVQMYLLFPAFYLLFKRHEQRMIPLAMWMGAMAMAVVFTTVNVPRAFHGAIFPPMFIGGMIAFRLLGRKGVRLPALAWPLRVLSLMAVRCLLLKGVLIDTPRNATVNAVTCLALGLGIPMFRQIQARWLSYLAHQIAKYSYGIYLLHVPSLELIFRAIPSLPLLLKVGAFVIIASAASAITYHFVEHPLIEMGRSWAARIEK